MVSIATSVARRQLTEIVNRVAYGKERVVIGRRGRELAAVIPIADLRLLERLADELEDRLDADDARRVERDHRDATVPWESVKRELKLSVPGRGEAKRGARARKAPPARAGGNRRRARRAG